VHVKQRRNLQTDRGKCPHTSQQHDITGLSTTANKHQLPLAIISKPCDKRRHRRQTVNNAVTYIGDNRRPSVARWRRSVSMPGDSNYAIAHSNFSAGVHDQHVQRYRRLCMWWPKKLLFSTDHTFGTV